MRMSVIWLTIALVMTVILVISMLKAKAVEKLQIFSIIGWITFLCYHMAIGLPEWTLFVWASICILTAVLYRLKSKKVRSFTSRTAKQL
ncbi:hypothetical protein SAMN05446037_101919 [Anaerovirgula multivorans]|uniref:Uncharacterized protein n=1 Tax=Anaerovirgula multivorans TaxID=312168 RepID=A0A239GX51_9FIRM|nr:hypothetical protein [Anaerovirgula multivorans]SNS73796.1 hypothetical protein SAMN05446037_101919 [Anaerovirgula multivorans]